MPRLNTWFRAWLLLVAAGAVAGAVVGAATSLPVWRGRRP